MKKHEEILTDEQINVAWGNADFGDDKTPDSKRAIIANALIGYACGFQSGRTIQCICKELELIDVKKIQTELSSKGKVFLYQYNNAMQQAVDQALAWVPVDAGSLPNHRVLCLRNNSEMFVGVIYCIQPLKEFVCKSHGMHHSGITHYFDPAKLKMP